jgi:hypothetical protein
MLLRRRRNRSEWSAGGDGILPLQFMPVLVGHFMKTKMSDRQFCTKCGGHLMNNHPPLGLVDVYAATIPSVKFVPVVHVNYAETVLPMKDGLPKLKDSPAARACSPN